MTDRRGCFRAPALAAALVLALAATLPGATGAQGKSTLDAIKERGSLRIGAAQAEPWFFKDPATQQWTGFGISLGKALADSLGVKLEIVEVTWGNAIAALQANRIDLMAVLDATPERQQAADFPKTPLLYYALAVIARDGLEASRWEDLNRKEVTIAVTQGTSIDAHVTRTTPNANILRFPSNAETMAAFQSGRADAASMFHPPMVILSQKVGRGRIVLPAPIYSAASSIAVRKEPDGKFRDWLDAAVAKYYASNQTQVWYEEFLRSRGIDPGRVPAIRRELWPKS
jgi:polar amino acid transport system substrate-binding protein